MSLTRIVRNIFMPRYKELMHYNNEAEAIQQQAFKYLLDDLEIPCILVIGDAVNSAGTREKHMWNYVEYEGKYYIFDATMGASYRNKENMK